MNTREHNTKSRGREQAIQMIAAHILKHGLPKTSLRQMAAAAEISDRMLLYYFRDKNDVLTTVLATIAASLSNRLERSLPADTPLPANKLLKQIALLTADAELRPYLHLGIELSASAVRGTEPFTTIARQVAEGYILWIEARLDIEDAMEKRGCAAMILGLIDGLAIISIVGKDGEFELALDAALRTLANPTT